MSDIGKMLKIFPKAIGLNLDPEKPSATSQANTDLPPAEQIAATPTMPASDDATVKAARRRAAAGLKRRQGRQSTILTTNLDDSLG